jgi:NAD+ kinase
MPLTAPNFERLAFVASDSPDAQSALRRLVHVYGNAPAKQADAIVALGGDGFMLETMHRFMHDRVPIYGMNRGSVGFLMNEYREDGLPQRIADAETTRVHPLAMQAHTTDGSIARGLAINEVSLFRQTHQAAKLRISIDGKERMPEMICDGVLVATPAGSTAYNLSAHGPILPINSPLLALTAISPLPTTVKPAQSCASTSRKKNPSICSCCSTMATALTNASCRNSSAFETGARASPEFSREDPALWRLTQRRTAASCLTATDQSADIITARTS